MFRNFKRLALLVALVLIFTISTHNTLAYVVAATQSIVNTFFPEETPGNALVLSKEVVHPFGENYAIPEGITFDFEISLGEYYANAVVSTSDGEKQADVDGILKVTLGAGQIFQILNLEAGTVVTVTELTQRSGFSVQGQTAQTVTMTADDSAEVKFVNLYTPAAADATKLVITGEKILTGRDWLEGDSFTFRLEQKVGEDWVSMGTKTITYDAANVDFAKFSFTDLVQAMQFDQVGVYKLRLSEVEGQLDHMVYDKTEKFIDIFVTDMDMDGNLEISTMTASDNVQLGQTEAGELTAHVQFNNIYEAPAIPDDIVVALNVQKTVVNNNESKVIGPENFKIILTDLDTGEAIPLMTGTNGTALFEILYSASDIGKTYRYTIHEEKGSVKNMTYDTTVYNVTVTVNYDETTNTLVPVVQVNGEVVDAVLCSFRNIHNENITPPTSDMMQLGLWSALMIASGAGIIVVITSSPRKKEA